MFIKDIFSKKKTTEENSDLKTETNKPEEAKPQDTETSGFHNFLLGKSQASKIYYKLWKTKKTNRLPLIILTSFRILVSSFFIVTVIHQFLSENAKLTMALLLITIFFVFKSRWVLEQYLKIEQQFLHNLDRNQEKEPD